MTRQVELFVHSRDEAAVISRIECTLDKATAQVLKQRPRCVHMTVSLLLSHADPGHCSMVGKGASAQIVVKLRSSTGSSVVSPAIPLEPFAVNKGMGRILLRRSGESVAAGERN